MSDTSNPHAITIPLDALGGDAWRVEARRFGCEDAARREWRRLNGYVATGGNFSAWSVQVPSTGEWLVVVCGPPANCPELYGVPHELDYTNALYFALRRARVGAEAEVEGELSAYQRASYGATGGRVIAADGTVRRATPDELDTGKRAG